jgi:hypothetical protein
VPAVLMTAMRSPSWKGKGRPPVLSIAVENEIANVVSLWHARHMFLSKFQLLALVLEAAKKVVPHNIIALSWVYKGTPSPDWFTGFLKRYPTISLRQSDSLESARQIQQHCRNIPGASNHHCEGEA